MLRIAVYALLVVGFFVLLAANPNGAQARGGLGGFHGGGFQVAHLGGLAGHPFGDMHQLGGLGEMNHFRPAYPAMSDMHLGYPGVGGMGSFHPALNGVSAYHPSAIQPNLGAGVGMYPGIHTGGILTPAPFTRMHFQPTIGYYHPAAYQAGFQRAEAAKEAYYYANTYYAPDPFYNPYGGLFDDPNQP